MILVQFLEDWTLGDFFENCASREEVFPIYHWLISLYLLLPISLCLAKKVQKIGEILVDRKISLEKIQLIW